MSLNALPSPWCSLLGALTSATTEAKRANASAGSGHHVKICEDPPQRRGYPAEGSFSPVVHPVYQPSRLIRRPGGSSVADSGASSPLLPRSATPTPSILSAGSQEILRVRCRILPSVAEVKPSRPNTPSLPPPPPTPPQLQKQPVTGEPPPNNPPKGTTLRDTWVFT
ncbi:uncharacterized protein LOC132205231 [Neocloeon triangulifer]|uniref:uncharacterized protein LOC132205231 n=1 Tax=Neocloeon triangulifer TaxID=2078957 RepID=UPI00286F153D|nr:uncharacterized protein LOC132205231 [Neocloeon triangulifer]